MNAATIHLAVNHLALFAVLFAIPLLLWGLTRGSRDLVTAGLVLGIVVGAGGAMAGWSGERAEDVVEQIPAVSDDAIDEHEAAAKFAVWVGAALAVASLTGLLTARRTDALPRSTTIVALALAVLMLAVVARTAWLGGMIRHPEAHGLPF